VKTKLFLIASVISFLIYCVSTGPEKRLTIEIQGVVTDSTDDSPIAGARIILWRETGWFEGYDVARTKTDSSGFYYLKYTYPNKGDCDPTSMTLRVGENLMEYKKELFSNIACIEAIQPINFQLDPQ
jgi:hypothetical protein